MKETIESLGPWFHNFHLPGGLETAPDHFLGDFPGRKWREIESFLPRDLSGWRCLDIGCNAGYYSFELAKRGASVLGIDSEPLYLNQAAWIAENFYPKNAPTFTRMQIHELAHFRERFDLVLFMGVFYHLRYPSLALDTVARLVRGILVFQTLTSDDAGPADPVPPVYRPADDYPITERSIFQHSGWPRLAFVERKYSNDHTNWFVPNHAAVEAMLRSTGFERVDRVAHEVYFCIAPPGGVETTRRWDDSEWKSATKGELR